MHNDYLFCRCLVLIYFATHWITVLGNHRENLALRHPCNSINKRLGPYIKWTEKLASSQYGVLKDACGQSGSSPVCCTHEIVQSYALSLAHDLKILYDGELGRLRALLHQSKEYVDRWRNEYVSETRHLTTSALESLFGREEYHYHVHHPVENLFNMLNQKQSSDDDVRKSALELFDQLIISGYRRFMTINHDQPLDQEFQRCLITKAYHIEALPTQRELLYTLTSAASLIHILQTMFVYIDADIQRMNETGTMNSNQCIQRYARETLCPICVRIPSSWSLSNNIDEPLCENDCRYVIQTCFDRTANPYIAFASIAQGYSKILVQIQRSIVQLKLVERLSKVHIYLHDMVVNATNTRHTYEQLQTSCPNRNGKAFSPIQSLPPIASERREMVQQSNQSLHFLLDQLYTSMRTINISLTTQISKNICSNSNYAVKSQRCTQIDQHTPGNFSQWPLPPVPSSDLSRSNEAILELTQNQLDDLERKMTPIEQIINSLQPKRKVPLFENLPDFESYDADTNTNDNEIGVAPISYIESYENSPQELLSERLYKEIDGRTTTRRSTSTTVKSPRTFPNTSSQSSQNNFNVFIILLFLTFSTSNLVRYSTITETLSL